MQTQLNPPVTSLANPPTVVEPGAITAAGAVRTHPSLSETDTSEAEKSEFLWNSHNYINEYIRYGDTKAAFVAATASALLGILYSSKIYVPIIQLPCSQWTSAEWFAIIAATITGEFCNSFTTNYSASFKEHPVPRLYILGQYCCTRKIRASPNFV